MKRILLLSLLTLLLFAANLFLGSVAIPFGEVVQILCGRVSAHPSWSYILLQSRLPQAVTALLAGASLAASGLMLQTSFRNPLAGPDILGINAGAGLGVAIVMLAFGGLLPATGMAAVGARLTVVGAAFVGAVGVTALLLLFATFTRGNAMLLIVGLMLGYLVSSVVSLLNFFSTAEGVQSYMLWGMGTFGGVTLSRLPLFAGLTLVGLALSVSLVKPLNALLLGPRYAESLGIAVKRTQRRLLLATGLLVAVTTAYCGPVSFLGLAVPHVARLLIHEGDHRLLLPATLLTGSSAALLCNLLCVLPGGGTVLPLAAITPLVGAPVILYVILKK